MIAELLLSTFSLYSIWKVVTNEYVRSFGKFLKNCFSVTKQATIYTFYASLAVSAIVALAMVAFLLHLIVSEFLIMWFWFKTEGYPFCIIGGIVFVLFRDAKKQEEYERRKRNRNRNRKRQQQWRQNQYIEYY